MVNSIMTNIDHSQEGETRFHIVMPDDENVRELVIIVTQEGIIMDVYDKVEIDEDDTVLDDVHSGTAGMMFDEWAEWVVDTSRWNLPDSDCRFCGERIHLEGRAFRDDGVYVDSTGGDVCCANKFTEKNENGEHRP